MMKTLKYILLEYTKTNNKHLMQVYKLIWIKINSNKNKTGN